MPRFTLSQLLMGTALVAIILAFSQTEGCGRRYTMIESLSFSPDGSRLAVTKLNARDAGTHGKLYKADISRTISWVESSTGRDQGLIHQDFESGNSGPAFHYWRMGRTSAVCSPSKESIAMTEFGGGKVTRAARAGHRTVVPIGHRSNNLAFSPTGRFLAVSGGQELTVFDLQEDSEVMRIPASGVAFLGASQMTFTTDESGIVVADEPAVTVWDLATSTKRSTVVQGTKAWINAITVTPDNTLIICSDEWVRQYESDGSFMDSISLRGASLCSLADDSNRLATYDDDTLTIYDLDSNKALNRVFFEGATALAFSSSGNRLAVGDYYGQVTMFDKTAKVKRWKSNPRGRNRWPWTLPAAFLIAWAIISWQLSGRQNSNK